MRKKTLLMVYHSTTDGTRQMVCAAFDAAQAAVQDDVEVRLIHAAEANHADVLDADAYVFAAPEHLGSMSGVMKDFFDRCYYPVLDQVNGRAYACMVCAGSDGQGAMRQLERIATGWRLKRVADGLIVCTQAQTPERILATKKIDAAELAMCAELGAGMALGLSLGIH